MTKREMILKFLEENPTGTYAMFGKDKGIARQYFDSTKRTAQINKGMINPLDDINKSFEEIHVLETLECLIDKIIAGKSDIQGLIRVRRTIGKRILDIENSPKETKN